MQFIIVKNKFYLDPTAIVFRSLLTTMCDAGAVNLVIMPSGEPSFNVYA